MKNQDEEARIAAAVQQRLEIIVTEQQQQFAKMMETAMKSALSGVDEANAALEKEREKLQEELDAAKELRAKAEREGEKMAEEHYYAHVKQYAEAERTSLLRDLTQMHIEVGKSNRDIAVWLDVPQSFVENLRQLMQRSEKYHADKPKRTPLEGSPKVWYSDSGRGGTVHFESRETAFELWWEFAGGGALAIVEVPTEERWEAATKLPLEKRSTVLNYLGEQIVLDQTGGSGYFLIGENVLTVYAG